MTEIAQSHVDANVPRGKLFDEYLKRDLTSYFCAEPKDCRIDYELLRNAPTQSGISYPKYYLWIKVFKNDRVVEEGAVRVAAIDQQRFEVTHFLSRQQILDSSSQVGTIFPAALINKIIAKAGRVQSQPISN